MLPALVAALDGRERGGRLRQVIFLTDGAVGNEERSCSRRSASASETAGSSRSASARRPNSHFMREAARLGRGTFTYDRQPRPRCRTKMDALFRRSSRPRSRTCVWSSPARRTPRSCPTPDPRSLPGEPVVVTLRAPSLPSAACYAGGSGDDGVAAASLLRAAGEGRGSASQWARAGRSPRCSTARGGCGRRGRARGGDRGRARATTS